MHTSVEYNNRCIEINSSLAEYAFLFLLREMQSHSGLTNAFHSSWKTQLELALVVELDDGLKDEMARDTFLQIIYLAKKSIAELDNPIPARFLRNLSKDVFGEDILGPVDQSKILSTLDELEDLVRK